MKTMLDQHKDTAYALLRIVSGFLFLLSRRPEALRGHGRNAA